MICYRIHWPLAYGFLFLLSQQSIFSGAVGEAIEQGDLEWTVTTGPIGSPDPIETNEENLWHPTTEITLDQIDSLTVIPPSTLPAYCRLETIVEGPVAIRFHSKLNFTEGPSTLLFKVTDSEGKELHNEATAYSTDWEETHLVFLDPGPLRLVWEFQVYQSSPDQAWLDQFEINRIRSSNLVEIVQPFPAPLGKEVLLPVTFPGLDDLEFQWFKEGAELPGETHQTLLIPPEEGSQIVEYGIQISDGSLSLTSDAIVVEHIALEDVLNNHDLRFSIPDEADKDYSNLIVRGEEAYDGESALFLEVTFDEPPNPILSPTLLSAFVEGPTMVNFVSTAHLKVDVDGQYPEGNSHMPFNEGPWIQFFVPIYESGMHEVTWSNHFIFVTGTGLVFRSGHIDQVSLSVDPIIHFGPFDHTISVGQISDTLFDFVAIGNTVKHELLRGEAVVEEKINHPVTFENLKLGEDGTYRIRISNELGGSVTSTPFEIEVVPNVEAAIGQLHLDWEYTGKPWEPQSFDVQVGDQAAWLPVNNSVQGNGILSTIIPGPAKVAFWWKRPSASHLSFYTDDREVNISPPDDNQWHFVEATVNSSENHISWNGEAGTMLDGISIDYLDLNFFDSWAEQTFKPSELEGPKEQLRSADFDRDGYTHLMEWIFGLSYKDAEPPFQWAVTMDDNRITYQYLFDRPPIIHPYTYSVEISEDLINWHPLDSAANETYNPTKDSYLVTINHAQPLDVERQFIRISISEIE